MPGNAKGRFLVVVLMIMLSVGIPLQTSEENADSLMLKLATAKDDTAKVNILLKLVNLYMDSDVKRAESYISTALSISRQSHYQEGIANSYYMKACLFKDSDIGLCEELNEQALEYAKKAKDPQILAKIYNLSAIIKLVNNSGDQALEYMRKAVALELTAHQPQDSALPTLIQNIGRFYFVQNKIYLARKYYLQAIEFAKKSKSNRLLTFPYMNLGMMYLQENKPDSGLYYYKLSLDIAHQSKYKRIFPELYNNLADFYLSHHDTLISISYLDSAMRTATANMNYEEKLIALNRLYTVYNNQHKLQAANHYLDQYDKLKDVIYQNRLRHKTDMADLKMKFNKEQMISAQKMRRQKVLLYIFIIFFILMVIIVTMILYINRLKNMQKQMTINNLMEKNVGLKQEIEQKSRELTNNILVLGQRNTLILDVIHRLTNVQNSPPKDLPVKISNVISELRFSLRSDMWELFEKEFLGVHPEFFGNLMKTHPDLTQKERRLCALLRLGLNTKEISDLMHLNNESVIKARTRLRKHFNLTNIDIDLTNYLSRF
ncbi:MAG: hypothetical protein Q8867_09595 [Bacteroidota bacterium]|nr:hypothetical protein [Bacteroidota bacterium]